MRRSNCRVDWVVDCVLSLSPTCLFLEIHSCILHNSTVFILWEIQKPYDRICPYTVQCKSLNPPLIFYILLGKCEICGSSPELKNTKLFFERWLVFVLFSVRMIPNCFKMLKSGLWGGQFMTIHIGFYWTGSMFGIITIKN